MTKSRSPFNFGKGLGFRNQNRVGSMGPFSHVLIKSSFLIAKLTILLSFSCRRCLLMVFTSTQCRGSRTYPSVGTEVKQNEVWRG